MTQKAKGPPRGGDCADGPEVVCFVGEQFPDSAPAQKYQAQNLVRRFGVRHDHVRLVPPVPPPPRPRRPLAVRISVSDGRAPHGRSRAFRLTRDDLDELIAAAMRMEARA
jgi:hypothetical protein